MMAGNPNWWIMDNGMQFAYGSTSSLSSSLLNPSPASDHHCLHPNGQEFPIRSWSQLIMGGSAVNNNNEEENWEEGGQLISSSDHLKQEENFHHLIYGQYNNFDGDDDDGCNEFMRPNNQHVSDSCSRHHRPVSSPTSCVTTLSNNNILSFSFAGNSQNQKQNHLQDHSSECNSRGTGGAAKKARVAPQSALKVRKEKLGDRITTLHNLVSPFGKTDTASVLSEANGYIRFLHAQIQALSSPYMSAESATQHHHQHYSSDSSHDQLSRSSRAQDLRSRGLCLVPTSCTQPMIENDIEADYWAPAPFNFSWRHEL